jgi:hypothetical protein
MILVVVMEGYDGGCLVVEEKEEGRGMVVVFW